MHWCRCSSRSCFGLFFAFFSPQDRVWLPCFLEEHFLQWSLLRSDWNRLTRRVYLLCSIRHMFKIQKAASVLDIRLAVRTVGSSFETTAFPVCSELWRLLILWFLGFREPSFSHHLAFGSPVGSGLRLDAEAQRERSRQVYLDRCIFTSHHFTVSAVPMWEWGEKCFWGNVWGFFLTNPCGKASIISVSFSSAVVPLESSLWISYKSVRCCNFN